MKFRRKTLVVMPAALLALLAAGAALRRFSSPPPAPPPPYRMFGNAAGPVTIVEFSDFACPACGRAWSSIGRLLDGDDAGARVEFRHYPLTSVHKWSYDAALYADCAGLQGKFSDFASLLFASREEWAEAAQARRLFAGYAARAGLDGAALEMCLADPLSAAAVQADLRYGDSLGINSTPTFFVNGKRAVGLSQLGELLKGLRRGAR
ncbi:MAG: thioredoxin domain-containing protein [Elusimicrobia bacterium]|nr:thioredoxin domain-containing protein [Elusimicrobiota bacterium]